MFLKTITYCSFKHARTCPCLLGPSLVSSSPAGSFPSRLFLKTSLFRLSLLRVAGKSWPAARAGTWDDNYTVLPLSGRVAEPSAHTITQNEGGGMLEEGNAMLLWLDVLPCLRAKLLQNGEQQEISPSGSFCLVSTERYGTVQCSMVWYGLGPNTLIQLAFPLPTVPLLDRRGVCRKVAIDNKAWQ